MRKSILVLITLMLVAGVIITGCAQEAAPAPAPAPAPTPAPTPEPTPEGPIKIVFASWNPTEMPPPIELDPYFFMMNRWMDAIEYDTGGKVVFERYPAETLVKMGDCWESILEGLCDVSNVHPPTEPGKFPLTGILSLPGLFPNSTVGSMVAQKIFDEGYTKSDWEGVQSLCHMMNSPSDLGVRGKTVQTLDDWKGLKVAVMGEPETSTIQALGALPVGIPVTEQYIALERGTVDATWLEAFGQVAFKFYEVPDFSLTVCGGTMRTLDIVMNQKKWDSLPDDVKDVFLYHSGMYYAVIQGKRFDGGTELCMPYLEDYAKKHGNPPIYYPPEEELAKWHKLWEPVYTNFVSDLESKGLPAQKMLDRVIELSEEYSSWKLGGFGF